jgi:hypothetical protein
MESPHDEQRFSAPRPVKLCSDQNLFCFYLELHKNKMNCELMLTYHTPTYMFNVYKNQLSRQTGSMNLTGSKTLPTIWYTYMKFVTKYQISAINSCWEKCAEKYLGRTEGRTKVKQYTPPPPPVERGYNKFKNLIRASKFKFSCRGLQMGRIL